MQWQIVDIQWLKLWLVYRYRGADRDKQIPNTLFRTGGAATLLTNKDADRSRSKYVLEHVVKVHQGADATSYR